MLHFLDLALGELVHHEIFGLFEAMSAIEMMDPKMDAGMCCNKNTATPLTFETAVSVCLNDARIALNLLYIFVFHLVQSDEAGRPDACRTHWCLRQSLLVPRVLAGRAFGRPDPVHLPLSAPTASDTGSCVASLLSGHAKADPDHAQLYLAVSMLAEHD